MKDFRDFKVWEKAHKLVLETYRFTSRFPKHELFVRFSEPDAALFVVNSREHCRGLWAAWQF
jgi:hypothetical protein